MVEHVFRRAALYDHWDHLCLATCDPEIAALGEAREWPVVMTSDRHTRALDRVAEATTNCSLDIGDDDCVVCVQGDEPMLHPDMIDTVIQPLVEDEQVLCTVLAMHIVDEAQFQNPDTIKIVHDQRQDLLYTSRAPVPYCTKFSPAVGARRIYGIFGFRQHFLRTFAALPESRLELLEACDCNRILDYGYRPRIAPFPFRPSFSVDSPADVAVVEAHLRNDVLWGKY